MFSAPHLLRLLVAVLIGTTSLGAVPSMGVSVAFGPGEAFAQDDDEDGGVTPEALAAARALFNEGIELEKEDRWDAALDKFEKVAAVKMTPQVRFHIALCHEKLGRLVDALNGFELAEQEARAAGDRARDVLRNAPKRAEALRARVAHVVIHVVGKVRTSKITIDGKEVALALVDSSIPVDPGDHLVEVRRDGTVIHSEELSLDEAEQTELTLEINDPEPPPKPDPKPDLTPDPVPKPNPDQTVEDDDPPQWVAYVVAGAGGAMLGGAGALWLLRQATLRAISRECREPGFVECDPAQVGDADKAKQYDVASKALLGVGAASVAAGVALWFILWPDDEPSPTSTGAKKSELHVVPGPTGVTVLGTF
ncbi:MAG TPA: hypothetical protein ENK57_01680 [Polyangiaceae bacterium]|nr:hypothetical protein [Polyangiaceae bacterium]